MPRPIDVADLVATAAAESPDRIALLEVGGRRLTWAQLDDEVARVATGLGELGVVGGHRVLIALGNRLEFVTAYLGVLRAHGVAVPVNPRSTEEELAWMIGDSGSRVVIGDQVTAPAVRGAVEIVRSVLAGGGLPSGAPVDLDALSRTYDPHVVLVDEAPAPGEVAYASLVDVAPVPVVPVTDTERLAVLLYTAGSTGRPRAAMLTHRALLANIAQVAAVEPSMMHGDDVVLGVLPLFHVYGLNAVLGAAISHRAKLVLVDHFDPEGVLDLIDDEAVSVLPVAPPVFAHWLGLEGLRERLGPVRLVLSGSASLSARECEQFLAETGLVVHQGYGLTEGAPVVTTTLRSQAPAPGSVGTTLPGVELRLVDGRTGSDGGTEDDEDPGHIQVRGENLFSGYWPDGADGPGPDGWWATGDVGYLDDRGDLHLVDAVRDVVVVQGFSVYPSEVEDVIAAVAGVREVAVIGVDDDATGQAVVAYLVLDDAADADEVTDAVRARVGAQLARFKQPARIELVDALPTTSTGRVQRGRLRGIERRRALGLLT